MKTNYISLRSLVVMAVFCFSFYSCELEKIHVNQAPVLTFERIPFQSSDYYFYPYEIIEHEGQFAVCGRRYDRNSQEFEGFLFRIDSLGILRRERWEKAQIHSMVPIELGYMTTGFDEPSENDYRLFVKSFIEVNGHPFEPDYGEPTASVGFDLIQTSDGNFLVAGYTTKNNNQLGLLLKLGPFVQDETIWKKTFSPQGNEFKRSFYYVEEQTDGSLIVFDGVRVLYMNSNGEIQNSVTLENFFSLGSLHKAFQISQDDHYIIADNKYLSIPLPSELVKFNSSGQEVARKTYRGITRFESLRPTADGGFVICGATTEFGDGGSDAFLLKVDIDLNEVWFRTYGGPLDERAYDVVQTSDGGFMIIGTDESISQTDALEGDQGLYMVKTDREGLLR